MNKFKEIKLDKYTIYPPLMLAPIAGITDPPFREIVQSFGHVGLMFSEMIPSKSLFFGDRKKSISKIKNSFDLKAVQIIGDNPYYMSEAAKLNVDLGANIIDINFGCPVKKVVKGFAGAAVMKDEKLAKDIMQSVVRSVNTPITIKMRLGWDFKNINFLSMAKIAEDVGIKMITIHARTRSQMYEGTANWKIIAAVKNIIKIPFIVNGDIVDRQTLEQALLDSQANGAMIARGVYGRPWLFKKLMNPDFTEPSTAELKNLIKKHLFLAREYYETDDVPCCFRKHLAWYSAGMRNSSEFRNKINKIKDYIRLIEEIDNFFVD